MNFSCDNCQRRYAIADEKVRGKSVKIKCKNCGHVITVQAAYDMGEEEQTRALSAEALAQLKASAAESAKSPWDDEATRAAPSLDTGAQWYAMINGQQSGPLDVVGLTSKVGGGQISLETFLWRQGMAEWKRASEIPELAIIFAGGKAEKPAPRVPAPPPAPAPVARVASVLSPEPATAPMPVKAAAPAPKPQSSAPMEFDAAAPFDFEHEATMPQASAARPAPAPNQDLGGLFSDVELQHDRGGAPFDENDQTPVPSKLDPFATQKLPKDRRAPAGEDTGAVVQKAGVKRRFRPLRALFVLVLLIALPVAALYGLTELEVMPPIKISHVDEQGKVAEVSVFSKEAVTDATRELREKLLGEAPPPEPAPTVAPAPTPKKVAAQPAPAPAPPTADAKAAPGTEPTAAAPADPATAAVGEKAPEPAPDAAPEEAAAPTGIPGEQVQKVVAGAQPGLKSCVERELKINPRFRAKKLNVLATVSSKGVVRKASLDRAELDKTRLGVCLKDKVKKLVFPAFEGEDVQLEIPLNLGGSL